MKDGDEIRNTFIFTLYSPHSYLSMPSGKQDSKHIRERILHILPGSMALSQRLMFLDKPITKADI